MMCRILPAISATRLFIIIFSLLHHHLPSSVCSTLTPPQSLLNASQYGNASTTAPVSVGVGTIFYPSTARQYPSLASNNGFFNLLFLQWQPDSNDSSSVGAATGNIEYCMAGVRYVKKTPKSVMWSMTTQPVEVMAGSWCSLTLTSDGALELHNDSSAPVWRSNSSYIPASTASGARLLLDDTGNLVVIDGNDSTVVYWESFRQNSFFIIPSGKRFTAADILFTRDPLQSTQVPDVHEFNVPGDYAMKLSPQAGRLLLFKYDNASMFVYYSLALPSSALSDPNSYVQVGDAIDVYNSSGAFLGSVGSDNKNVTPIPNGTYRAFFFQSTGDLKFNYGKNNDEFYDTDLSPCQQPTFCGSNAQFKLCSGDGGNTTSSTATCSCPVGFREEGYNCVAYDGAYTMTPIPVSFHPQLNPTLNISNASDCSTLCNATFSCNAALYDSTAQSCSLFPVLYTIMQQQQQSSPTPTQFLFLKITAHPRKNNLRHILAIALPVVSAVLLLACCCAFAIFRHRLQKIQQQELFLRQMLKLPPRYSYKDLQRATKNFSTSLGVGAFGSVYFGEIDGVKVAVKKIEGVATAAKDGGGGRDVERGRLEQFKAEVATIGSVSHVNLVTLRGFCMDGPWRMLIYEYMENGSLDRWLFKRHEAVATLDWETRCKIALQTAKGLEYLHHESASRIVHCDVKPENILLDAAFNAKVADFGLAKLCGSAGAVPAPQITEVDGQQQAMVDIGRQGFAMTTLKGTRGYLAPEWLRNTIITAKSDVFSYGVVVLEMMSGRRSLEGEYLPSYARRLFLSGSSGREQEQNHLAEEEEEAAAETERWSSRVPPLVSAAAVEAKLLDSALLQRRREEEEVEKDMDPEGWKQKAEAWEASVERMTLVALACVRAKPEARPTMAMVVQMLEGVADPRAFYEESSNIGSSAGGQQEAVAALPIGNHIYASSSSSASATKSDPFFMSVLEAR